MLAFAHIPTGAAAGSGLDINEVKSRTVRSAVAALSHLYEHLGLVRLTQLGRGPSWVKA
jgi:hypothetical protein